MIIVTGATGRLGSQVVDQLLARVPAQQVGVSVRDVSQASDLAARGVRVRRGDFTEPATLDHAFEGADQVLVVSAAIRGPGAAAASRTAIDAAIRAGAGRVLYTSHQAAAADSRFAPQPQHAATEAYLAGRGIAYTALRHGFYSSTLDLYVPAALETGAFRLPADGPFSWTAHADLAEADAIALVQPALVQPALDASPTLVLTAPELLDFAAVAEIVGELTGRSIRWVVVDDEQWRADAIASGMPAPAADFTLGMFRAARRGEFAVTDPTLERTLGRPATCVRSTLAEKLAAMGDRTPR